MRVVIDAHAIGERLTGNETYITNLIDNLVALDGGMELTLLFTHKDAEEEWRSRHDGVKTVLVRPANPLVRIPLAMPLVSRLRKADILHVQYVGPPVSSLPLVVTVHDISYEHYPEFFTRR